MSTNKSPNWKVFWMALIPAFLIMTLHYLGVRSPQIVSPVIKANVFDSILPKLEQKPNTYTVKHPISFVQSSYAASDYDQAKAYIAINYNTGDVLAEKNSDQPVPIASLTKIMTAVVALDLSKQDTVFGVSDYAARVEPTRAGVIPGQKFTEEEMLNAMLMTSANDAAQVVMEGTNKEYNADVFVQAMNAKAQFLGLKHTHFTNPQGYDNPNHYSTAEDLATLSKYALTNYPLIAQIVRKEYQFIPANANHKQMDLYNWNGLLGVYPGVEGVKIGNTDAAGTTMVALSNRNGQSVLTVLLGAPGILQRDEWTAELLDFSFQKLANLQPVNVTETQLRAKYATWQYWGS